MKGSHAHFEHIHLLAVKLFAVKMVINNVKINLDAVWPNYAANYLCYLWFIFENQIICFFKFPTVNCLKKNFTKNLFYNHITVV